LHVRAKQNKAFLAYVFFSAWFFAGFLLISQVIPLDATVADRWFYFPLAGLLGMIGIILQTLKFRAGEGVYFLIVIILVVLSIRTVARNSDWINAVALYSHDSKILTSYDLENNLGLEYSLNGNYKQAIFHFKKSLDLYPYDSVYLNLAGAYEKSGDLNSAKRYYFDAIQANQSTSNMHKIVLSSSYERLAFILLKTEAPEKSLDFIKSAIKIYPTIENLWIDLAVAEYRLNNREEALKAAKRALEIRSDPQIQYLYEQIASNKEIELR
jgi:tetratricopeptide (TPR) repeat protein